jgi:hypothetical protein
MINQQAFVLDSVQMPLLLRDRRDLADSISIKKILPRFAQ